MAGFWNPVQGPLVAFGDYSGSLNCCSPAVLPLLLLSIVDVAATEYVAFVVYSGSPKVEAELLFSPVIYLHSSLSQIVQ
jgi:hypothetical protein